MKSSAKDKFCYHKALAAGNGICVYHAYIKLYEIITITLFKQPVMNWDKLGLVYHLLAK